MSQENPNFNDVVNTAMSPPKKQEYGAILSATEENIHEVSMGAVRMMKITGNPILIILKGGK